MANPLAENKSLRKAANLAKQAAPIVRDEAVGVIKDFFYKKLLIINLIVAITSFFIGVGLTLLFVL